jgi:hypothetical protein
LSAGIKLVVPSGVALATVFSEAKYGRPAATQKFLLALAAEQRATKDKPRPVCPRCCEPMVRSRIETDGGVTQAWLCECDSVTPVDGRTTAMKRAQRRSPVHTTEQLNAICAKRKRSAELAAAPVSSLRPVEIGLMLAMRRTQDLIEAYRGQQPADRQLKQDLEWAIDAFQRRDDDRMARLTARMNDNLPPIESNVQDHAQRPASISRLAPTHGSACRYKCHYCGRIISGYIRGGDGSIGILRTHINTEGQRCEGSKEEGTD